MDAGSLGTVDVSRMTTQIELAELMIDNDVGVSRERTFEIKKIDSDYSEDW